MILEIKLKNFYSINEEIVLDLRAGNLKNQNAQKLKNNIFGTNKEKVVKTVAIYGANASGKSNIIKAISLCCSFILHSHNFNQNFKSHLKAFKFNSKDIPSTFFISFILDDIKYEYTYSMDLHEHRFLKESLHHYPKGKKARIFERDETKGNTKKEKYAFGEMIKKPLDVAKNTSDKTLYLSRASQMDRELAKKIFLFFHSKFILQYYPNQQYFPDILSNIETYLKDEKIKNFLLNALQIADSDIADIQYRKFQIPIKDVQVSESGQSVNIENKIEDRLQIFTFHKQSPNIPFDFFSEESDGTKKLFFILLKIFDIIENNKILLIDEIETHLHPIIVKYILQLFHNSKSQLIFSTHNTNLLDLKTLRKDQIYFVDKKQQGASDLYSLYDFKDFRETMDLEKAYLQGRFDAIPFIKD